MNGVTGIVPCFNEQENIPYVYARVKAALAACGDHEILFVDDGSSDQTLALIRGLAARDPAVRYLSFARNYGLEAAFSAAFKYASKEWVVQFDGDLQSPPEEALRLLERAVDGDFDAVFATRRDRRDHALRRLGSQAQHEIARRLFGIELPRGASSFRVVRASVARKVVTLARGTRYFIAALPRVTARYTTLETEHAPRHSGRSKWRVRKMLTHSAELFYGYSRGPLEVALYLSVAAALCGLGALGLAAFTAAGALGALALAAVAGAGATLAWLPYLRILTKDTADQRFYFIREANVAVAPEDDLYEFERNPRGSRSREPQLKVTSP